MNTANPYAPPQAAVSDVAASGSMVKADRGTRLGAALLDGVLMGAMIYLPLVLGGALGGMAAAGQRGINAAALFGLWGLVALAGFVAWCVLNLIFVLRNGQSIGKKILGIKVVRSDGSKASLGRIFWLRNVVNGVIALVPFYGFVDALFIFGEAQQCVHDKLADTIVIKA
jgi:uncharacterized RDD family membrane protein YckC